MSLGILKCGDGLVYILAYGVWSSITKLSQKVDNGMLDMRHLPAFFFQSRRFMTFTAFASVFGFLDLIVFGFWKFKWYMVPLQIVLGHVVAMIIEQFAGRALILYSGGVVVLALAVYLWVRH